MGKCTLANSVPAQAIAARGWSAAAAASALSNSCQSMTHVRAVVRIEAHLATAHAPHRHDYDATADTYSQNL